MLKFEILIQLSPAFVLGTRHTKDDPRGIGRTAILAGLFSGLGCFAIFHALGVRNLGGFHAGSLSMLLNYGVALGAWRLARRG